MEQQYELIIEIESLMLLSMDNSNSQQKKEVIKSLIDEKLAALMRLRCLCTDSNLYAVESNEDIAVAIAQNAEFEEEADADDEQDVVNECPNGTEKTNTEVNKPEEIVSLSDIDYPFSNVRFTLNDRFRFTRELFHGDNEKYNKAVAAIHTMHDVDQVKDFLAEIMDVDQSNEAYEELIQVLESALK